MQTFVVFSVLILVTIAAVVMVPRLLARVTSRGGDSNVDAAHTAGQALAWSDAFRGSSAEENPPWEGEMELAPPVVEGGG